MYKSEKFTSYDYFNTLIYSNKITLMICQDCNLSCKYCYGGESGKFKTNGTKMSFDVAKEAVDYLLKNNKNKKKFHLTFLGGEPLLNKTVIENIFNY